MQHSRLSASKSHRWLKCPGSVKMSEGIEDKPSKYAEEGTQAHELAERCLCSGKDMFDLMKEDNSLVIPLEMANAIQFYVDYVREL